MQLIDQYHRSEPVDTYTFVFDEQNPDTGQFTMLPLHLENFAHSQFVEDDYDPDGENEHLGKRVLLHELGAVVLNSLFIRLGIID